MAHKKTPTKIKMKIAKSNPLRDLGILIVGDERLTITNIRLIDGTISFEAEGISENDYTMMPIKGVTILDPKKNVVYAEPEYEIPKLKTVLTGDRIHFIFNLDPQLHPAIEMWVRAK